MTKTTAGTTLPTTLKLKSKLCLGCHDGTIALGDVSNAGQGKAGVISVPAVVGLVDAAGKLIDATHIIGAGGNMGGNHPISIPYAGQIGYNGISSAVPAAQVDNGVGNYWKMTTTGCTSPTGICTEATGAPLDGTKINLVPNTPGALTNAGVECGTCHEPHNKYAPNLYFTRVDVANASALCRSCHNK